MKTKIRTWRVVPTSKTGAQAPYYFVVTTESNRTKAEVAAIKLSRQRSALSKFDNWHFIVSQI